MDPSVVFFLTLTPIVPQAVGNLLLMDSRTGTLVRKFNTGYWIDSIEFLPDGRQFMTSPYNAADWKRYHLDTLKVWDHETGEIVREYGYKREGIRGRIAVSSASGGLYALSARTSK